MGYSPLRSPRRRFGRHYSPIPLLASIRAELDARKDIFIAARRRRADSVARVTGKVQA